jgi:hypothetical protein
LVAEGTLCLRLRDAVFEEFAPGAEVVDKMLAHERAMIRDLGAKIPH